MRILFVNDDGYDSEGLHAVARLFAGEHDIAVVAPAAQRSGYSHSVTLPSQELGYSRMTDYGYATYAVEGTPVDCVKLGATHFFASPDLVVSGINKGRNLGSDILYSGTVSAASEACSLGCRAIALSLYIEGGKELGYDKAARFFKDNFEALTAACEPHRTFLNINFPCTAPKGARIARMCTKESYICSYTESGGKLIRSGTRIIDERNADADEGLCCDGYITITPLTLDRTDYGVAQKLRKEIFVL